jgi:flagellar biosynthesis protein FlhG
MTSPTAGKPPSTPCRIIAVGGAKGGIGKSILAANVGVYLARRGLRTVLVDLDLGAANLHLYMGVWGLKHRIDDYLDRQFDCLDDIAVATDYGPRLIGGGSGRLGAANLPFARKLKLMRAIRKLDADYVVLDLGASTNYNILDFFLLANTQLVMTTCDPAAYLDAYTFIKMALYRRLARLFGSESKYRKFKDEALQGAIQRFVAPDRRHLPDRVCDLMDQIRAQFPRHHYLVEDALHHFQPKLVVNLADNQQEVRQVVTRMQKVADRMLSVRPQLAGTIFSERNIARSTRDLKPEVGCHPNGLLARAIGQIVRQAGVAV